MRDLLTTQLRVLTFRISRDELLKLNRRHLAWGLAWTWIVGIGRWWDDPGARLLQHLGLGSLIYLFVLSLLLWALVWPLIWPRQPREWTYFRVLTFVSMCSPPAILYAIPVERWYGVYTAAQVNVWFLLAVAAWRVALLAFFIRRLGRLRAWHTFVATALPIMGVIVVLTILNLERAAFEIMGGIREPKAVDDAYSILVGLTFLSFYGAFVIVPAYLLAWREPSITKAGADPQEDQ